MISNWNMKLVTLQGLYLIKSLVVPAFDIDCFNIRLNRNIKSIVGVYNLIKTNLFVLMFQGAEPGFFRRN